MDHSPLIIEPKQTVNSSVIWLHGLGANKYDFRPIAQHLQQSSTPNTRYILPQAPRIPVTLNSGFEMPAWYDIVDLKHPRTVKVEELDAAAASIQQLIDDEIAKGIPREKIFLAGFSQGGAVVLHLAYIYKDQLIGGVLALSTYFPTLNDDSKLSESQKSIPSIHLHGTQDNVVPVQYGKDAHDGLKILGVTNEWHEYPMRHEASPEEIAQIGEWLKGHLHD